jgi:lipopolysaccharide biosynthesis regulator YciM
MGHFIILGLTPLVFSIGWYLGSLNAKREGKQVYCLKCRRIMNRDRWVS